MSRMEEYSVMVSRIAIEDLKKIRRYIAHELCEPETAEALVNRIQDEITKLRSFPYSHQLIRDSVMAQLGIRYLIVENYIAYFRIQENTKTVEVLRVAHERSNWQFLFE